MKQVQILLGDAKESHYNFCSGKATSNIVAIAPNFFLACTIG